MELRILRYFLTVVQEGSIILVKASRGMALEELVAFLKEITPEAE